MRILKKGMRFILGLLTLLIGFVLIGCSGISNQELRELQIYNKSVIKIPKGTVIQTDEGYYTFQVDSIYYEESIVEELREQNLILLRDRK